MTDRQAAVYFAQTLAVTLDSYGHLGACLGIWDHEPCDSEPCRRAREAVQLAIGLGYLPLPAADLEATGRALRSALDRALLEADGHPKMAANSGDPWYTNGNEIEGRATLRASPTVAPTGVSCDA